MEKKIISFFISFKNTIFSLNKNIEIKIIPESEANKSAKNMLIANERGIREINNTKNLSCNSTFLKKLMMSFMI